MTWYAKGAGETYTRTLIPAVEWEATKASNVIRSGLLTADSSRIFVPFGRGSFRFKEGDVLVKGSVPDEQVAGEPFVAGLKTKYPVVVTITSVDIMDMGSAHMHHWQIGAR